MASSRTVSYTHLQVGHAVEVASQVIGDLGLTGDDLLAHLGDGLDPLGLPVSYTHLVARADGGAQRRAGGPVAVDDLPLGRGGLRRHDQHGAQAQGRLQAIIFLRSTHSVYGHFTFCRFENCINMLCQC